MKRGMLRWLAVLLALMVVAVFAAGCGDSGTTTTTTNKTDSATDTKTESKTESKTEPKTEQNKPADSFQKDPNTSLAADKTVYKPGEQIVVKFTAPASFSEWAWIGLIPSHVKHGSEEENDNYDIDYSYLEGKAQGEVYLTAPDKAGDYDVRMNSDDDPASGKEVNYISIKVQ